MFSVKRKSENKEIMMLREKNGVYWLTFPMLDRQPWILHGFSTRLGGVSTGHLYSMNLSFSRGDREENVRENYRRLGAAIGFDPAQTVFSDQTHTDHIRLVTAEDRGKGYERERDYHDVDGLITQEPGLVLSTFYADCVPLYFVDPVHHAIGLSHSGWRGTVARIGAKTVRRMSEVFGSRPEDIYAAIGPSICRDCYEVSEDVIEQFRIQFDPIYWPQLFDPKENGKYQLDLWKANERILLDAGILPEHLEITDLCTCCNPELLYSHRASQGKRGNLAAFLMIQNGYDTMRSVFSGAAPESCPSE